MNGNSFPTNPRSEGKMQIRKLLNNRSLKQAVWHSGTVMLCAWGKWQEYFAKLCHSQERLLGTERTESRYIPLHASEPHLQPGSDRLMRRWALKNIIYPERQISQPIVLSTFVNLEGQKDYNDNHRDENTDYVQSIP
ncbi:hypothetical protein TNCV_651601 [Trichonephila clavipes]|nr:hypothetical protein TNCV_651601 [Trichonephila clavipes]